MLLSGHDGVCTVLEINHGMLAAGGERQHRKENAVPCKQVATRGGELWLAGGGRLTSAFQSRAVVRLYFLRVTYMLKRHGR